MDCIATKKGVDLFGGHKQWDSAEWTASDDRVRGGKSQSYLEATKDAKLGHFHGTLDIKTLGGAGFASQRTATETQTWDLSHYDGLQLHISKGDGNKYTLIIKDSLPARRGDGRDEATISWEYDFETSSQSSNQAGEREGATEEQTIRIPWSSLKPTYRGREKKDVDPLDTKTIRRFSIMMRSFFGDQEGDFSLSLRSISAYSAAGNHDQRAKDVSARDVEKANLHGDHEGAPTRPILLSLRQCDWRTVCWLGFATGLTLFALRSLYHRFA